MSYLAPLVVREPAIVRVTATLSPLRESASIDLDLLPGSVAGAEDCLGPGQSFLEDRGGLSPLAGLPDELPELIRRVEPVIPRSALVRGVEETVRVNALVCRTGRVIAAVEMARTVRPPDPQPEPADPRLAEAAIEAVLQWEFKPARVAGAPIATWVATPVRFRP